MTLLYTSPLFLEHKTGRHPENPQRLGPITRKLAESLKELDLTNPTWSPATLPQLQRVHGLPYIEEVQNFAARGGGQIEVDTVLSSQSYDVALLAAGAACDAVQRVMQGVDPVGSLRLESEDFAELTQIVLEIATTHAQGRIVSLLEGGYHPQALGESIAVHLQELAAGSS